MSIVGTQQSFMAKVEESYSDYLYIFVHGFRQLDSRVRAAMYIPKHHYSRGWILKIGHSVLVAVLLAILKSFI